ncbi:hypothetical protein D3C80_926970 [compost metagenome]
MLEIQLRHFVREPPRAAGVMQLDDPLHRVPAGCGQHHAALGRHETLRIQLDTDVRIASAFERNLALVRMQTDQRIDQALDIAARANGVSDVALPDLPLSFDHRASGLLILIPQGDQYLTTPLDDLQQGRGNVLAFVNQHVCVTGRHLTARQACPFYHQQHLEPDLATPNRVCLKVGPQAARVFKQHPGIQVGQGLLEMRQMPGRQAVIPGLAIALEHLEANVQGRLRIMTTKTEDIQLLRQCLLARDPGRRTRRLRSWAVQKALRKGLEGQACFPVARPTHALAKGLQLSRRACQQQRPFRSQVLHQGT